MNQCPDFTHLLCIPRLQIQNANAVSSPLTHGFPAMSAFLGLMWALERKARAAGIKACFNAVGVICHQHQELITDGGFVNAFRLTRNPLALKGHARLINRAGQAKVPAIVEEGRMHMEVSLLFAIEADHWRDSDSEMSETKAIAELLQSMRVAGGTIRPPANPRLRRYLPWVIPQSGSEAAAVFRDARNRLLPGSALVLRDDLLDKRLERLRESGKNTDRLDAWLSLSRFNWTYQENDSTKGEWVNDRPKGSGWVVPIPVGYGALSENYPAGSVANARDMQTPFRFVESLYSIGEWLGPHRIESAKEMLWYAHSNADAGAYRCQNDYQALKQLTSHYPID